MYMLLFIHPIMSVHINLRDDREGSLETDKLVLMYFISHDVQIFFTTYTTLTSHGHFQNLLMKIRLFNVMPRKTLALIFLHEQVIHTERK